MDASGEPINAEVTVTDPDGNQVALVSNARFVTEKTGKYTVTVNAKNSWGISAVPVVSIGVSASASPGSCVSPLPSGGRLAGNDAERATHGDQVEALGPQALARFLAARPREKREVLAAKRVLRPRPRHDRLNRGKYAPAVHQSPLPLDAATLYVPPCPSRELELLGGRSLKNP